jgi:hypothetical protein
MNSPITQALEGLERIAAADTCPSDSQLVKGAEVAAALIKYFNSKSTYPTEALAHVTHLDAMISMKMEGYL